MPCHGITDRRWAIKRRQRSRCHTNGVSTTRSQAVLALLRQPLFTARPGGRERASELPTPSDHVGDRFRSRIQRFVSDPFSTLGTGAGRADSPGTTWPGLLRDMFGELAAVPYPKQFLKISFLFTVLNTDETAVTSVNVTTLGGAAYDAPAAAALHDVGDLEDLADAYVTMVNAPTNMGWASYSQLTGVKLAPIAVDGTYAGEPLVAPITGIAGDNASISPQETVALSFWSGLTLGRANYGRMYLPHTHMALTTSTPYALAGVQSDLATAGAVFVRAVNTMENAFVAGSGVDILSSVGSGLVKPVAQVRAGRLNDTQRRRRNNLTEDYVVVAV
uniref:Uncharacterized protein n=1 Tax=uncultured prokaryote TaxID=198431 RepID=A0A0H5Q231_9ZZZZ|nr:hypothetical protein [uncultured prokaryote]